MHARFAKRLHNSSLRYWILEFLRRQPKEKKFRALILRFIKDRNAALLLMEVSFDDYFIIDIDFDFFEFFSNDDFM